jgi:DNA-binding NarL/FixJ family response regulator
MIRVVIVDDQQLVRTGFRALLSLEPDIAVVGEGANGYEAVALVKDTEPDVVLMDIRMPSLDGIEATQRITDSGSTARVIMLTTFDLDELVHGALRAGASAFLLKDALPDDLIRAVRVVAAGDALLAPSVTRRLLDRYATTSLLVDSHDPHATQLVAQLTDREREVLTLIAQGLTNGEIADATFVAETTVKTHVGRIFAKLGARDRVQAVIVAYDAGLAGS